MDVAADRGVGRGAADLVHGGDLTGGRFDHFRPADEHVGAGFCHNEKIHERRRVGRAAGAGSGDDGDLRDDAGEKDVAEEDLSVAGEREHAFLDAGAAGVVESDDGDAGALGVVHEVADFLGVDAAERSAGHEEILAEGGDGPAFHQPDPGDHTVGRQFFVRHAEAGALVLGEHAEFLERTGLEKGVDPFAGGEEAFLVAFFDFGGGAADEGAGAAFVEGVEKFFVDGHAVAISAPRAVRRIP
jgi:hypothetical protein